METAPSPHSDDKTETVTFWTHANRGMLGKCPACGDGKLFKGILDIAERCDACGLEYFGHDAGDGPAVAGIFVLGFGVVAMAVWVEFAYLPPLWVHVALWGPITILGSIGLLRPLKGLTAALQHRYRALNEEEKLGGQ